MVRAAKLGMRTLSVQHDGVVIGIAGRLNERETQRELREVTEESLGYTQPVETKLMPTKLLKPDYKWTRETRTETARHKIKIIPDIDKSLAEITQHLNLEVGDREERTHTKRFYSYLTITHAGDRDIEPGTVWSRTTTISGRIHPEHPVMMDLRRGYVNIENETWTGYNTREEDDGDSGEDDEDPDGGGNDKEENLERDDQDRRKGNNEENKGSKSKKDDGGKDQKGEEEKGDVAMNESSNEPSNHDDEKGKKRKRGLRGSKDKDQHEEGREENESEDYND